MLYFLLLVIPLSKLNCYLSTVIRISNIAMLKLKYDESWEIICFQYLYELWAFWYSCLKIFGYFFNALYYLLIQNVFLSEKVDSAGIILDTFVLNHHHMYSNHFFSLQSSWKDTKCWNMQKRSSKFHFRGNKILIYFVNDPFQQDNQFWWQLDVKIAKIPLIWYSIHFFVKILLYIPSP